MNRFSTRVLLGVGEALRREPVGCALVMGVGLYMALGGPHVISWISGATFGLAVSKLAGLR